MDGGGNGRSTGHVGVGSWIERWARVQPDRAALVHGPTTRSYAELAQRVRSLAAGLRELGVERGDRVAWLGPNHPAFVEVLFAAARLGAIVAPVNHRLAPDEQAFVLELTEPVVVVASGGLRPPAAVSVRHRLAVGDAGDGEIPFDSLVEQSSDDAVEAAVDPDDLVLLPHTSGTTGRPKAVMLTHANVTWNAVNFVLSAGYRRDDVTIAVAPFFRVGGSGVNVLPLLFAGGTVVVPEDGRPDELLRLVERHRVTVGFGNPDLLDELSRADRWHTADLSSIRFVVTGGAPVPERLIRAYLERGVLLLQGYGLSEAAPLVLLLDAETALAKVGSAGRPPILVDVRVAGADGAALPSGTTGELLVRGPNVMAGYWRRPDATRAALGDDGWLRTGDAARIDEDGDVWIVDRLEARFRVDGTDVYPGDVERVLLDHPAVADAGVVGLPTGAGAGDTRVVALVVLAPGAGTGGVAESLLAFLGERLAPHQVPGSIAFVDRLPRNAVGKLVRAELRALAQREAPS